jgi:pimeloyl-ACP methyl ester carboxylesterase
MPRPLSQLIHARIQEGCGSPRVITLHKHNQRAEDVRDYGLAAAPNGRVIGLESYKGIYIGREIVGYTWFVGPLDRPSPLFFGDALSEIERFLWDEIDRQEPSEAELPFLVGVEQGGIMALAAAGAAPDLLSGMIAIDAFLPIVPGWEPPLAPLDGLPVLLVARENATPAPAGVLAGDDLAKTLRAWGASVEIAKVSPDAIPQAEMAGWISRQDVRHRSTSDD